MKTIQPHPVWGLVAALSLLFSACNGAPGTNTNTSSENVSVSAKSEGGVFENESISDVINICHASNGVYEALALTLDELLTHSKHADDLIPAPADGCPADIIPDANDGKITICHATSSQGNQYNKITISINGLNGHRNHPKDLLLEDESDECPGPTPTPTATPTITPTPSATLLTTPTSAVNDNKKITICHATGSKKNRYNQITISINGLNGHEKHPNDIIPAPAGGCPK